MLEKTRNQVLPRASKRKRSPAGAWLLKPGKTRARLLPSKTGETNRATQMCSDGTLGEPWGVQGEQAGEGEFMCLCLTF